MARCPSNMPNNGLLIIVHKRRFQVCPATSFPEVGTSRYPLQISVDWRNNRSTWSSVTVGNFDLPSGYQADPPDVTFSAGEEGPKEIWFRRVDRDATCKFEIHFVPAADPTEPYILDPAVVLRP